MRFSMTFAEVDEELRRRGLDRAWLAKQTGRSIRSVSDALAPGAVAAKRSPMLLHAMSEAIRAHDLEARLMEYLKNEPVETRAPQDSNPPKDHV